MSAKTKLNDTWALYYSPRGKKSKSKPENYENNLNRLGKFNTVEDFFGFYCFLQRPSEIDIDNKIILFRDGIRPMWEVNFIKKGLA